MKVNRTQAALFWSHVAIGAEDACWPWKLRIHNGYGCVKIGGSELRAHRVAWALARRQSPGPRVVRHACDNPACCNPRHLRIGTQKQNLEDMWRKGRARPRGVNQADTKPGRWSAQCPPHVPRRDIEGRTPAIKAASVEIGGRP